MMQPLHTNLLEWAASLIIDFPDDDIPMIFDEEQWQDWGSVLVQENSFAQVSAPNPNFYEDWNAWAIDVYYTMANNA